MEKTIYIRDSVYMEGDWEEPEIQDKNIDHIGRMCISAIKRLCPLMSEEDRQSPVFFGSVYSSLKSLHEFNMVSEEKGPLYVNPGLFPNTVLNAPFCRASIHHKIKGPIFNVVLETVGDLSVLELACAFLKNSAAGCAIVCVAEEASDFAAKVSGYSVADTCAAVYLTTQVNDLMIRRIEYEAAEKGKKAEYPAGNVADVFRLLHQMKNEKKQKHDIMVAGDEGRVSIIRIG